MPVDPSVGSDVKRQRLRRRLLLKRRQEAQALISSSASIKKSVSFQPMEPRSDAASVGQCSKASDMNSGRNRTYFRSILKASKKTREPKVVDETEPRRGEGVAQARPCASPPSEPPVVMPRRHTAPTSTKRRKAPTIAPSPSPSNFTNSTTTTDYVYSLQGVSPVEEGFSGGLCGPEAAPWKQAAEHLQDQIQDQMAITCAGVEGGSIVNMGSCLDDTASITQQGFGCGAVDVKEYQRKLPESWYGTLDSLKERFRSDALDEACCDTTMKRATSCNDEEGFGLSSARCAAVQDTTTTYAKSTMQTTYNMVVAADEVIGPVVGEGCIQTEAWCKENIAILLADDCPTDMNLCSEGFWPWNDKQNGNTEPAGETPKNSAENEKDTRESVIVRKFKSAGASIRRTFEDLLPQDDEPQQARKVILDLPPDFGHDSKNLKDKAADQTKNKEKQKGNGKESTKSKSKKKANTESKDQPNKDEKSAEKEHKNERLINGDESKSPPEPGSNGVDSNADEKDGMQDVGQDVHSSVLSVHKAEANPAQEIEQTESAAQIPEMTENYNTPQSGPREPDGEKPVPDDLSMERRENPKASHTEVTAVQSKEIIDCTAEAAEDVLVSVSQGTRNDPILLVDDKSLLAGSKAHPDEFAVMETNSYVSALTADAGIVDTGAVMNSEIQEHVKELVEGYISRRNQQKKASEVTTFDARETTDEILSALRSQLSKRSKGKAPANLLRVEQRERPPAVSARPVLPSRVSGADHSGSLRRSKPKKKEEKEVVTDIATFTSEKLTDPSLNHEIIDASAVQLSEHRDDWQGPLPEDVVSRNYERDPSQQDDAHSWLLHDSRYENPAEELTTSNQQKPPLPAPIIRQFSNSSIDKPEPTKYSILPSRTKSVSFQDHPEDRDDASKAESCGSSRVRSTSTSSSTYRNKRDIILARREELAALSKRQAKLFARGRRTIASHLAKDSMFSVAALS